MEEITQAIYYAADKIGNPNCAAIVSTFGTVCAVIVAVIVACKQNKIAKKQNKIAEQQMEIAKSQATIAEQQNKIALFEKRYDVYCTVSLCIVFARGIKKLDSINKRAVYYSFQRSFGKQLNHSAESGFPESEPVYRGSKQYYKEYIATNLVMQTVTTKLEYSKFLFSERVYRSISEMGTAMARMFATEDDEQFISLVDCFYEKAMEMIKDGTHTEMENDLQL